MQPASVATRNSPSTDSTEKIGFVLLKARLEIVQTQRSRAVYVEDLLPALARFEPEGVEFRRT